MNAAFEHLAKGDFVRGFELLSNDPIWADDRVDLDGPFSLAFPGTRGWGEELLTASLLKRHATRSGRTIVVAASDPVESLLRADAAFQFVGPEEPTRPPLAVLHAALLGDLLDQRFSPLVAPAGMTFGNASPLSVGVAWASIADSGHATRPKSIPFGDFREILGGRARIRSFRSSGSLRPPGMNQVFPGAQFLTKSWMRQTIRSPC